MQLSVDKGGEGGGAFAENPGDRRAGPIEYLLDRCRCPLTAAWRRLAAGIEGLSDDG